MVLSKTGKETIMDAFGKRVRTAAVAGWWTILIGAAWISAAWFFTTWILAAKPDWVLALWGGIITWEDASDIVVRYFTTFKIIFFVMLMLTIWLSIWASKLKKAD